MPAVLSGPNQKFYAERKEKKETQNGHPQTQEAFEKEPSQEEVIFLSRHVERS
jgi:hypothetical protein